MVDSHGIRVAGKALGKSYGVAKQANLVVVQIWNIDMDEVNQALRLVFQDLNAKPERRKKRVINMSLSFEQNSSGPNEEGLFHDLIERLLDMDIPVFACAGNYAENPPRTNVDTLPDLWAAPNYPLIVVGSTDHGGARSPSSQGGPQVTLHAPENEIACMLSSGNSPATNKGGTSFATPIVAGEAADLLSYATRKFRSIPMMIIWSRT